MAAKLEIKLGLPNVPITPFVLESHGKKSKPKLWKTAYKDEREPLNINPKNNTFIKDLFATKALPINSIKNETKVSKPKPRPVRPNICCSIGALLAIVTKAICTNIKTIITSKYLYIIVWLNNFLREKITGNMKSARRKSKITLGIIKASLLKFGVAIKVMITET